MEIERKYLIDADKIPCDLSQFKSRRIEQAYLNVRPVVRVRQDGDVFYLTYKSAGLLAREEYNLPLDEKSYHHLLEKADGMILTKVRYVIPIENNLAIELDIFEGDYRGLILAEVEFPTIEMANSFTPPEWFGRDVTETGEFSNSRLSQGLYLRK